MTALNRAEIIGNLGRDPETRNFDNGGKVANLSVATTEKWRDKNSGEQREATEWHRVAVFGPLADVAERYLQKGSKVFLAGKLKTRKWQDQNGQDRYSTEIVLQGPQAQLVMLDGPGGGQGGGSQGSPAGDRGGAGGYYSGGYDGGGAGDLDDEIPF